MTKNRQLRSNPSEEELYSLIGRATNSWAKVEEELCNLFELILPMETLAPRNIFYTARSIDGRLDLLNAVIGADFTFSPNLKVKWTAINSIIVKRKKNRNKIAHSDVIWHSLNGEPMKVFVRPYADAARYKDILGKELLDKKRMGEIINSFLHLAIKVAFFQREVAESKGREPKSLLLINGREQAILNTIGLAPEEV